MQHPERLWTINRWDKKIGDTIKLDECIAELENEEFILDLPSSHDGTITELLYKNGDQVKAGTIICRLHVNQPLEQQPEKSSSPPEGVTVVSHDGVELSDEDFD